MVPRLCLWWCRLLLLLTVCADSCTGLGWHPGRPIGYFATLALARLGRLSWEGLGSLYDGHGLLGLACASLAVLASPGKLAGDAQARCARLLALCLVVHAVAYAQIACALPRLESAMAAFGPVQLYSVHAHAANAFGQAAALVPNATLPYKRVGSAPFASFWEPRMPGDWEASPGPELVVDVYLPPAPKEPGPIVLHLHGGGWSKGTRKFLSLNYRGGLPGALLEAGCVIVSVQYRLAKDGWAGEHMLQDAQDALQFAKAHASDWGADPARVIPMGTSAGGHLAALLAYRDPDPAVVGLIALYGIFDLREADPAPWDPAALWDAHVMRPTARKHVCRGAESSCPAAFSPITHLSPGGVPALLVHGRGDALVPVAQTEAFAKALGDNKIKHALVDLPCADHDCDTRCSGPCGQAAAAAAKALVRHLC